MIFVTPALDYAMAFVMYCVGIAILAFTYTAYKELEHKRNAKLIHPSIRR